MDPALQPHLTHLQLLRSGLSPADIAARVKQGSLTRIRRGVYCRTESLGPEAEHLRLIRATLPDVHPDNVISHVSAALLHGLPVPRTQLGRVTMTRRTSGHTDASPALLVRNTRLTNDEVTTIDGMLVTTLERTVSDVARISDYPWSVATCDAALALGLDRATLQAAVARHPRLHGLSRARHAVEFADRRSESPAESISRVQFARHGIPPPELQFEVIDDAGVVVATSDFAWPEWGLVGEVDGKWKYGQLLKPGRSSEDAIMQEKRREEEIRLAGYWIVRWDWEIANNGAALSARIRKAMEVARRRLAS